MTALPKLLDDLRKDKEKIVGTETEAGLLLKHRVDLENKLKDLIAAKEEAMKNADVAAQHVVQLQLDEHREDIREFVKLAEQTGTATGRALAARKMMSALDYSLSSMEANAAAAKGSSLTQQELEQVKALHDELVVRLAAAEKDVTDARERAANAESELQHANLKLEVAGPIAERVTARLDKSATAAMGRIRARGLRAMAGMDPEDLADHAIIGAAQLARGARRFAEWSERMIATLGKSVEPHLEEIFTASSAELDKAIDTSPRAPKPTSEPSAQTPADIRARMKLRVTRDAAELTELRSYLRQLALGHIRNGLMSRDAVLSAVHTDVTSVLPNVTRNEVRDVLSGYGDFKPLDRAADKTRLREIQAESQKLAQLEALEQKKPPLATGFERGSPNDETRRLTQQVNAAKKAAGIGGMDEEGMLKSALSAAKTRTRNLISDLQTEIDTGQRIVRGRSVLVGDTELVALKAQLAALRKVEADVFQKTGMSDDQRVQMAVRLMKGTVEQWAGRIEAARRGAFSGPNKRPSLVSTELEALRAQAKAARAEYEELKNLAADPKEIHPLRSPKPAAPESLGIERSGEGPEIGTGQADEAPGIDLKAGPSNGIKKGAKDLHPAEVERLKTEASNRAYRTRLAQREADLLDRMAREDYGPRAPRPGMMMDEESRKRQADVERVKQEYKGKVREFEKKNRPPMVKAVDYWNSWVRMGVLSSPGVFLKLLGAATARVITTPLEQAVGYGISKALPRLSAAAPRHGVPTIRGAVRAEAAAQARMWTEGLKGSGQLLRNRRTTLDLLHDSHQMPPEWSDYIGNLHAAFKNPVFEAEYARSYQLRTEHAIANGINTTDPIVHLRLSNEAYIDGKRAIFKQENRVTKAFKAGLHRLEQPKANGKPSRAGLLGSAGLQTELPIVAIPTNYAHEIFELATGLGTGAYQAFDAYRDGIDNLDPIEADAILRQLKKGALGAALMALGFFLAAHAGGLYLKGAKKPGKHADEERHPGDIGHVPHKFLHTPFADAFQVGATARQIGESMLGKRNREQRGYVAGLEAAAFGILDEVPYIRETSTIENLLDINTQGEAVSAKLANLAVPIGVQWIAKQVDPDTTKRNPIGLKEQFEARIPGLRQNVSTEPLALRKKFHR